MTSFVQLLDELNEVYLILDEIRQEGGSPCAQNRVVDPIRDVGAKLVREILDCRVAISPVGGCDA